MSYRKNYNEIIVIAAVVLLFLSLPFFFARQEAATFNKFKKPETPEATMWDALFSELRIED